MSNAFTAVLQETFAATEGAVMVSLLGMDGLPIERVLQPREERPEFEEDLLSAQYSTLFKNVTLGNRDIGLRHTREVIVSTDDYIVVMNLAGNEFLVVTLLRASGNLGRARYENRRAAMRLEGLL
jgi:predicted regulator of Ras-like GTPase activity (Roadblock/LC7/MglB family)